MNNVRTSEPLCNAKLSHRLEMADKSEEKEINYFGTAKANENEIYIHRSKNFSFKLYF